MNQTSEALLPAKRRNDNDDNMIPLINIVFLLLIFFMVAGQIKAMPDASIQLPSSTLKHEPQAQPIRLEMNRQGELLLNAAPITVEQLLSEIRQLNEQLSFDHQAPLSGEASLAVVRAPTSVALFVDRRVTADKLTQVLQPLRQLSNVQLELHTEVATESAENPMIQPNHAAKDSLVSEGGSH